MNEKKLREALTNAGHSPLLCAWFRAANSEIVEVLSMLMMGAAAIGAGAGAAGGVADVQQFFEPNPHENKGMPHHVAVAVTSNFVEVWGADEHHTLGKIIVTFTRGTFRGHLHHYPERVDVTMDDSKVRLVLTGSWTHFNDDCLETARAAVEMAIGPAY
jgi:hypothetical protein